MKRNMDLIRHILFLLEEKVTADEWLKPEDVEGYFPAEVGYHIKLMYEAGLIEAIDATSSSNAMCWIAKHPTWEGHDFLESARNENIWNKAKSIISERGGAMSYDVLKQLLIQLVKDNVLSGS